MLKTFYKLQKRSWLKSWGVSNCQNEKSNAKYQMQCQIANGEGPGIHNLVVENYSLPCIFIKRTHEGFSSEYDGSGTKYDYTHYFHDGLWLGNCQLSFLEALGLGTAIVAGIRYTVENEKYKRVKPVNSVPYNCHSLLDQVHNAADILWTKHETIPNFLGSSEFCVLPKVTVWNNGIKRLNSESQSACVLRPFVTFDESESSSSSCSSSSNSEELSTLLEEDSSSCSQPTHSANQNEIKQNGFFLFQALIGVSTFSSSSARHFLPFLDPPKPLLEPLKPLLEPLKDPPSVSSSNASSSSSNLPTDCSGEQTASSYQNDLQNLTEFLEDVKKDFLIEEKCKIAVKMAKRGLYKKSAAIWNEILESHPTHAMSLYNLAVCYENGLSFKQDLKKAKELYQKAADMNHPMSWYRLARIYLRESDTSDDRQMCLDHYRHYLNQAAMSNVTRAERDYGILLYKENNFKESLTFLERAASKKDLKAKSYVSMCQKAAFEKEERVSDQSILPSYKERSNVEQDVDCSDSDESDASSSSSWGIKLYGFDTPRASSLPQQKSTMVSSFVVSQALFLKAGPTIMV